MAEKFTPKAIEILLDWQRRGMKFSYKGTIISGLPFKFKTSVYSIPRQPLPKAFRSWDGINELWGANVHIENEKGLWYYPWKSRGKPVGVNSESNLSEHIIVAQPIPDALTKQQEEAPTEAAINFRLAVERRIESGEAEHSKRMAEHITEATGAEHSKRMAERITEATGAEAHAVHHKGERDPFGLNAHEPGAKLDAGKNRVALVMRGFSRALTEVGRVGTYGADKYTPNGWQKVGEGIERYDDSMMRHWLEGRTVDKETGLLHAAQVAWNALAVLELMLIEEED